MIVAYPNTIINLAEITLTDFEMLLKEWCTSQTPLTSQDWNDILVYYEQRKKNGTTFTVSGFNSAGLCR